MPSASLVMSSNSNVMENNQVVGESPLAQANQILEKKMRNLEKRKAKLDNYRSDHQKGKELNEDQKAAIAKYDEVLQSLEFARELSTQFKGLMQEEDKQRKKQLKKEQLERSRLEISRVTQIIELQETLKILNQANVRSDLTSGNNGAPQLNVEELNGLDELCRSVQPGQQSAAAVAEHLLNIVEAKTKKLISMSYKDLAGLLDRIKSSGYLTQCEAQPDLEQPASRSPPRKGSKKESSISATSHHNGEEVCDPPEAVSVVTHASYAAAPMVPPVVEAAVTAKEPIKFLQDSQIDLESPHMDPAVVLVQRSATPMMNAVMTSSNMPVPEQLYSIPGNAAMVTDMAMPQHYAHLDASEQHKDAADHHVHPQDAMANIDDWSNDQGAAHTRSSANDSDHSRAHWKSGQRGAGGNGAGLRRGRGGPGGSGFRGGFRGRAGGNGRPPRGRGGYEANGDYDAPPSRGRGRGGPRFVAANGHPSGGSSQPV